MSPLILALVAAAGAGLIYWGMQARPAVPVGDPTEDFAPSAPLVEAERVSFRERIAGPITNLARPLLRGQRTGELQVELQRAGLNLRAAEFVFIQAGTAALVGLVFWFRLGFILGIVGAVGGYFVPPFYLRMRQRRRRKAFEAALADTIMLMSNGVKAGYGIQQALASVAESGRPPLSDEIGRVVRETSLGIDLDVAIQHANERLASKDFDLMVTAIMIHRSVGGNLAEVLDKIAETIRERVRVHGEVQTLTAQARASGYIITGLPFAVGGILSLISPGFEKPLFTSALGIVLIVIGLISISIGYALIRKITDIHI